MNERNLGHAKKARIKREKATENVKRQNVLEQKSKTEKSVRRQNKKYSRKTPESSRGRTYALSNYVLSNLCPI